MVAPGRNSLVYQAPANRPRGSPSPASSFSSASTPSLASPSTSAVRAASLGVPSPSPQHSYLASSATSREPLLVPSVAIPSSSPVLQVFGDSFCQVFSLLGADIAVDKFKGASARGLGNPHSTLRVGPEIVRRIELLRPRYVLLQFGNTDLHINYLWQLKARGSNALGPSEFANLVASEFCRFLTDHLLPLANSTGIKIYVAGALPPVVEDRYLELAAAKYIQKNTSTPLPPLSHSAHPCDLLTRRSLVKLYNRLVSQFCARHPTCLSFVSINHHLSPASPLEPERVSKEYVDSYDPTNIHLIWERTIQHWCRQVPILRRFLPQLERDAGRLEAALVLYGQEKRSRVENERQGHRGIAWSRKSPFMIGGNPR
ncbi:hypothetical protein JCM11491_007172 [Sporobolomyces phaffii]